MGISFSEYLIEARIRKATELLEQTRLPVEEIAERIGIDNVSYFYKFYKRETGRTPRGKH
jgi:YesN/AraC family two-component response regulator